jgi:hypothetical protein
MFGNIRLGLKPLPKQNALAYSSENIDNIAAKKVL